MKRKIVVVGGGTAGLISAITLIRVCEDVEVTVIRSSKIGHIMVGEGTFAATPSFLHGELGIPKQAFYEQVNPVWKLGVRFLWGPRPFFDYPFAERHDSQILPTSDEPWGYYCLDDWEGIVPVCKDGSREGVDAVPLPERTGYHVENRPFVEFLEAHFVRLGGELVDAKVIAADLGDGGIRSVRLESGESRAADYFVDASGFAGVLLHRHLDEPWVSMRDHLFCNRAVVGGWARAEGEPIKPYTTAETMNAGWCWQIEHEEIVNRGYVFSGEHLSDDEAAAELIENNPRIQEADLRVIPFESRHVRRAWVGNVVAIGNASGFVEPLEATNIQVICSHALLFARAIESEQAVDDRAADAFNRAVVLQWENIRDFLALHYRFNTRLKTPFWEMAVRKTPLGRLEDYVERYQASGPRLLTGSALEGLDMFGYDGYLAMLLGMRVPWARCEIQ